jgi:hypothetical protein
MSAGPWRRLAPYALIGVLTLLLLVLLSLQPWQISLAVGGDQLSGRREDDAPYLTGVYASEPADRDGSAWTAHTVRPYRWTTERLVAAFPGAGSGRYRMTLTVAVNTPDGSPMPTVWATADWQTSLALPHGSLRRYSWLLSADGTPELVLSSAARAHGSDPRPLGVVLHAVTAAGLAGGQLPAPQFVVPTLILMTALLLLLRANGLDRRLLIALLLVCSGLFSVAFVFNRTALLPALTPAAWAAAVTAVLVRLPPIQRHGHELQRALTLSATAVTVRLVGLFHPHAIDSDIGFHANNLLRVTLGWLQLTAGLPAEAGGGLSPYPSGFYLLAAPLQLLFSGDDAARRLIVTAAAALLDGGVALLLWWWLRREGYSARAALTAAALCIAPAAQLEALSIGELANVAGQALALPALLLAGSSAAGPRHRWACWSMLLAAALLLHSGVTLSVGLMAAALVVVTAIATRLRDTRLLLRLMVGAVVAAAAAFLLFYSAPALLALLDRSGAAAGGGQPPLTVLTDAAAALFGLAAPPQRALRLPPGLALVALPVIWQALRQPAADWAARLVAAAVLAAILSSLLLLFSGQSLRWAMFLGPWLSVAAAVVVERWNDRRWTGVSVGLLVAVLLSDGIIQWFGFVRDYLH